MRRVFRIRTFTRWMRGSGLTDSALSIAVSEMADGLIDADLGGHVFKKRVALPDRGKRGGARTIVAAKLPDRWFFLFGFEKNERTNIDNDELRMLREIAGELLGFNDRKLAEAIANNEIVEVLDESNKT